MKLCMYKFIRPVVRSSFRLSNKLSVRCSSQYYKVDDNIFSLNNQQTQVSRFVTELDRSTKVINILENITQVWSTCGYLWKYRPTIEHKSIYSLPQRFRNLYVLHLNTYKAQYLRSVISNNNQLYICTNINKEKISCFK